MGGKKEKLYNSTVLPLEPRDTFNKSRIMDTNIR
jgi:hypothetical protein